MKKTPPKPQQTSSLNTQSTTPSLQSMRDILSSEISKVQSRELLNKFYALRNTTPAKQALPDGSMQDPSSILEYSFLHGTSSSNRNKSSSGNENNSNPSSSRNNKFQNSQHFIMIKNSSTGSLQSKPNLTKENINVEQKKEKIKYGDVAKEKLNYLDIIHTNNNINSSNTKETRDIYQKQMALKIKKELRLEQLRQKKLMEEMSNIKPKPTINNKSKKLSKKNPPLIQRLGQIEEKTKEKIRKIQNEIMEEEKMNYMPEMFTTNKIKYEDFDEWVQKNERWDYERKVKLQHLKEEIKEFETEADELKFKPEINKKSELIVKSKGKPLSVRLSYIEETREDFAKRKMEEMLPSFKPKINKNYHIGKNYYDFMNEDQVEIYNSLFR